MGPSAAPCGHRWVCPSQSANREVARSACRCTPRRSSRRAAAAASRPTLRAKPVPCCTAVACTSRRIPRRTWTGDSPGARSCTQTCSPRASIHRPSLAGTATTAAPRTNTGRSVRAALTTPRGATAAAAGPDTSGPSGSAAATTPVKGWLRLGMPAAPPNHTTTGAGSRPASPRRRDISGSLSEPQVAQRSRCAPASRRSWRLRSPVAAPPRRRTRDHVVVQHRSTQRERIHARAGAQHELQLLERQAGDIGGSRHRQRPVVGQNRDTRSVRGQRVHHRVTQALQPRLPRRPGTELGGDERRGRRGAVCRLIPPRWPSASP